MVEAFFVPHFVVGASRQTPFKSCWFLFVSAFCVIYMEIAPERWNFHQWFPQTSNYFCPDWPNKVSIIWRLEEQKVVIAMHWGSGRVLKVKKRACSSMLRSRELLCSLDLWQPLDTIFEFQFRCNSCWMTMTATARLMTITGWYTVNGFPTIINHCKVLLGLAAGCTLEGCQVIARLLSQLSVISSYSWP